ncbi:MAG: hypothetical protein ACRDL1_02205 [Solirubrobacterales bacterium]
MGRRIAVSSIIRHVPAALESGLLRVIDLDTGRALLTAPIPQSAHRAADPNPRGGLRGARGVSFSADRFVLANTERLFVLNREWQMVGELSNSWTADIHEILAEPDGTWVTCTACDLLLKLGWDGELLASWSWRSDRRLAARFGFDSLSEVQPGLDYRDPRQRGYAVHDVGHLNAVTRARDGLVVSLGRVLTPSAFRSRSLKRLVRHAAARTAITRPAMAALRRRELRKLGADLLPLPDRGPGSSALVLVSDPAAAHASAPAADVVLRQDGLELPNHNVLEVGDLLVYNDTNRDRLVAHDRSDRGAMRSVDVPGNPGYARGLAWLGGEKFVVGSQRPTALHTIDLGSGRLTSSAVLGRDAWESVSSIAVVPESFDDPPARLRFA